MAAAMAKLDRLQKQDDLLRKRAGDFIVRDIKEIEELEALEKQEEEERARIQKEEEDRQRLIELLGLPPSSDEDQLAAALSHSAASSSVNPSLLADFGQFVDCVVFGLPVYDPFHFVFFIVCFVLIILGVLSWFQ
ncbi:uncharacterized protein BDW70DRAFT_165309 [Aspergillus foveolatus]|uniref:uncharacterized protein n=1 Tax=Aspergillus foveolatus TaxID=210207 RepID=UPI003CCC907D